MSQKLSIRDMVYSAFFATLTAILSYITIPLPFSPVPITAQSLGVMLAGCVLTPIQAVLSMVTFLFMGAIGLPVFSGGTSGVGIIIGKTGGYLIGYLVGALIISAIVRKCKSTRSMFIACLFGGVVIVHILGSAWLGYIVNIGIRKAFMLGSLPFLLGDTLKAIAAVIIASKIIRYKHS